MDLEKLGIERSIVELPVIVDDFTHINALLEILV